MRRKPRASQTLHELLPLRPRRAATPARKPAAPSRRTQVARSNAARERLLNATLHVLIDRGFNGLTTKEVAVRAGFSSGALVHHYGTKAELVLAATAFVYDRCIESGKKIAASPKALTHPLRAFVDDCFDVYLGWPFIVATEVMLPGRTDQTLRVKLDAIMHHYRETMNAVWIAAFERAGVSKGEASFQIMTTLNMIRGMGINSMWQRNVPYYKKLLREWVATVESGGLKGHKGKLR